MAMAAREWGLSYRAALATDCPHENTDSARALFRSLRYQFRDPLEPFTAKGRSWVLRWTITANNARGAVKPAAMFVAATPNRARRAMPDRFYVLYATAKELFVFVGDAMPFPGTAAGCVNAVLYMCISTRPGDRSRDP